MKTATWTPTPHLTIPDVLPARRPRSLAWLAALATLFLSSLPVHAQAPNAVIEGRVQNAATGGNLPGARVSLAGSNRETLTNSYGEYRFADVAAGEVRVTVSRFGFETQSASQSVAAGAVVRSDFALGFSRELVSAAPATLKLGDYLVEKTVLGARMDAINEEMIAPNLKTIVALNELSDRGDGNIGELLRFTPGYFSVTNPPYSPFVSVARSTPYRSMLFLLDGAEVASPSLSSGNLGRGFDPMTSPAGQIDRIEYIKGMTPDLPAHALGGLVNIVRTSPFAAARPVLRVDTYATYSAENPLKPPGLSDRAGADGRSNDRLVQPGVALSYTHPVNQSFAFSLNLSHSQQVHTVDSALPGWDWVRGVQMTPDLSNSLETPKRQLAATTLEWRLNPASSLRFDLEHVKLTIAARSSALAAAFGAGATGNGTFTQGAPAGNDVIRQTFTSQDHTRGVTSAGLRFRHDGREYAFEVLANYSRSWDDRKDLEHGFFRTLGTTQSGPLVVRADGLDRVYDQRAPLFTARTRTGQTFDPYDSAELSVGNPTSFPYRNEGSVVNLGVNVSREFTRPFPLTLKTGLAFKQQKSDYTGANSSWVFTPPGGAAGRLVKNLGLTNGTLSQQTFFRDTLKVKWASPFALHDLFKAHPEYFVFNEATAYDSGALNSKYVKETISAAYVRGDARILSNRLRLVAGVRFERTDVFGQGYLNDGRAIWQQDANGNLLIGANGNPILITIDPLAQTKLRSRFRGSEARHDYDGIYPSGQATFHLTNTLVARFGYARTLTRPGVAPSTGNAPGGTATSGDILVPQTIIALPIAAPAARTINVANWPTIEPWESDNFDFSLEAYGIKGAVASVNLFRREISGLSTLSTAPATVAALARYGLSDDYLDYTIISRTHPGKGTIEGGEASWRQSLYFLPAWARGLHLFGNATRTRVSGPNNNFDFRPYPHKTLNWGVSYVRKALSVSFAVTHMYRMDTAMIIPSATVPPGTTFSIEPQTSQDLWIEYRFAKRFSIYGSARNLNSTPKKIGIIGSVADYSRLNVINHYGSTVTLGLRSEF